MSKWREYFDDMYRKLSFWEKIEYQFWYFVADVQFHVEDILYRVFGWKGDDE